MEEAVSNSLPLNIVTMFIPVLFFFLGLNSNLDEVKKLFINKTPLAYGVAIQILALPLIGFATYAIFRNTIFSLAAVIVLIVPGGHISGLLTHIKKGNVPLSVLLTSTTSILSPVTIVFWLTVISSQANNYRVDIATSFVQLVTFVLSPFVLGIIFKNKFKKLTNTIFKPLDIFLKILIVLVSIWTPVDLRIYILEYLQEGLVVACFSIIMVFFVSRIIINKSKVDLINAKTLQIEALCQNFPIVLGISLAIEIPEVAIYGIIYYLISTIFAVLYAFTKKY